MAFQRVPKQYRRRARATDQEPYVRCPGCSVVVRTEIEIELGKEIRQRYPVHERWDGAKGKAVRCTMSGVAIRAL